MSDFADECIELTRAFERQRAVKIAERVLADFAERLTEGSPYWAGFDQACEEIIYRLKSEEWTLRGPPMTDTPTPLSGAEKWAALEAALAERYAAPDIAIASPESILLAVLNAVAEVNRQPAALTTPPTGSAGA